MSEHGDMMTQRLGGTDLHGNVIGAPKAMSEQHETWYIAGHNGIVVDGRTGEVSVDEYAKKNLRTVAIDIDSDGKYVEFAVTKTSAGELRDRLIALEQSLAQERQQLPALLDELEPAWREAYSDPLNLVRVLQAKAQEATDVHHERQQREAAEARIEAMEPFQSGWENPDLTIVNLQSYTAKLLALAVEQRRALEAIASTPGVTAPRVGGDYARNTARAALATDLDALVAEAKELGIDTTTPAMAHEKGNAPR